jgi:siroheme synthase (precorrin-2 oxidase/ferrochelatase)
MKTYKKLIKRKIQSMLKLSITIASITGSIGFISAMMQGLNKQLGTTVLYSQSFIEKLRIFYPELLQNYQFTFHEGPQLKGKSNRVDVYSPMQE